VCQAKRLNPAVGFWDPLQFSTTDFFPGFEGDVSSQEASIAWLRHAEIKHGRVAMAGFVGFLLHESGSIPAPWAKDLSAPDIWDACPTNLKISVLLSVGLLEWSAESAKPHYMNGGLPGVPPLMKSSADAMSRPANERREKSKLAEINNGRLAMLGLMGLISSSKGLIVPGLDSLPLKPYAGEVMGPFTAADKLPFVDTMLSWGSPIFGVQ
jgi:hypothetical protein